MRLMILAVVLGLQGATLPSEARADELSPWFGSADQQPFRIDFTASGSTLTDPTLTNSTAKPDCEAVSCPEDGKTAITTKGEDGLSQN